MDSSQSQVDLTPSSASRPQRSRLPPSNPGMIAPSPDSRRRVSADHGRSPAPRTSKRNRESSSAVIEDSDGNSSSEEESENEESGKSEKKKSKKKKKKTRRPLKKKKDKDNPEVCSRYSPLVLD